MEQKIIKVSVFRLGGYCILRLNILLIFAKVREKTNLESFECHNLTFMAHYTVYPGRIFGPLSFTCYNLAYRKIPNISSGLIDIFSTTLGTYIRRGLYSEELIFEGAYIRRGLYSGGILC